MHDALSIAATGMQAQQLNVDTIANNLVNVNTPGFKKGRVTFTDLMTSEASRMNLGEANLETDGASLVPRLGAGVGITRVGKLFDAGTISQTGSSWDLAIQGEGFIPVALADGTTGYSRGGTLKVNSEGLLTTQTGQAMKPSITIPAAATGVTISSDGQVLVTVPNQSTPVHAGQLQLVRFSNAAALVPQGDGLYRAGVETGEAITAYAGQDGLGSFQQGFLEGSNVKMVDEMVNLMVAQRTYEASVKVAQASDEMQGLINNLRK
ncbi:flagellar basal-body rod protein FlgG [Holophaga foetida]|uniref:flagellar basal-body rod protein FlgG n=1 Tax=Holophaga foetida TaxID=35839 RepID=UPI0002474646|nr:flagellar basal-body rod protein FlgG [Holophaga foetida]